ncbi:hypothetical protein ACHHYP_05402 [Achlya hypogyna]|uniref:Ankyrin repeat protein n=1 Tax=Achlya hypogyna TaxID=1202772 RepID=A0A1V9ZNT0_ACHHY|nr:hypothetical protein ACHHYP_05402 [Achlya hypogyna]
MSSPAKPSAPATLEKQMYDAVKAGNVDAVRALLEKGVDINAADEVGYTALHWAAWTGPIQIVTLLLGAQADVDSTNDYDNTPLHWAAWAGKEDAVLVLLQAGADIHQQNDEGDTALHFAAREGHEDTLKLLLHADADMHITNFYGQTARSHAEGRGHDKIIEILDAFEYETSEENGDIKMGADAPTATMKSDATISHIPSDLDAISYQVRLALYHSAKLGDENVVCALVAQGAETNGRFDAGYTALHWAAWEGHDRIVEMLLGAGAVVDIANDNRNTPLHWAAWAGRKSTVELLLRAGANVNLQSHALYLASKAGDIAAVKSLLDQGANPNEHFEQGYAALHWAAWEGNPTVMEMLVAAGASIDIENNYYNTPLQWAAWAGHATMVQMLLDAYAEVNHPGHNRSSHYTVYEMAISCPLSGRSWVLKKRFSDFLRFRQQLRLLSSMITPHPDLSITIDMIQSLLCVPFPKKHNFHRFESHVIAERTAGFRALLTQAMVCRTAAVIYTQKSAVLLQCPSMPSALEPLSALLLSFLNVPPHLQTTHLVENTDGAACSICLSEFAPHEWRTASHIVQLPCRHLYHATCVVEWLQGHQTCPLCRAPTETMAGVYVAP